MTIAVPIWRERISPVLDTSAHLLIATCSRGRVVRRQEVLHGPLSPEALVRSLKELRVNLLLCGALSEPFLREIRRRGIEVRFHLCGEVERILRAHQAGELDNPEFQMPGCGCCLYAGQQDKESAAHSDRSTITGFKQ